jgi:hypothetical protein
MSGLAVMLSNRVLLMLGLVLSISGFVLLNSISEAKEWPFKICRGAFGSFVISRPSTRHREYGWGLRFRNTQDGRAVAVVGGS